jgi:ADP-heptose:LPS heptosyltransferase
MHLAISEHIPVVALFSVASPESRIPRSRLKKDVIALYHPSASGAGEFDLENPSRKNDAMRAIPVDEVYTAVMRLLR